MKLSDPRLSLTEVDAADPFESTERRLTNAAPSSADPPTDRLLTPTIGESDPATALVRHASFIDLPAGTVVGEIYEIDAKLGAGAMGEVYAARHVKLGKRVAIKVIGPRLSEDAAAIERFAQEARTLARVQHPAIVTVDHVGELADGRAYFVMEYLRGTSLFERLQQGRVPLPEALRILDQMARGLEAAHAQGVTHRDLKPENIYLAHLPGEAAIVKLLDFGLIKLQSDVDQRAERTQSGVALGTPMYMSPEQARGSGVDHRTDIYSLGCVAYELLLGVPPFPHARSAPELYAAHLHAQPPLPRSIWPEIPPQLDLVLFAMLAKDSAYRPTLAQARSVFAAVLVAARTGTPSQRAATEFVAQRPSARRTRTPAIVAGTLIVGILIGAVLSRSRGGETPRATSTATDPDPMKIEASTARIDAVSEADAPSPQAPRTADDRGSANAPPKRRAPTPQRAAAVVEVVPDDGGVLEVPVEDPPPPPLPPKKTVSHPVTPAAPPIDRNQTVDPFPAKRAKVIP